MASEGTGCVTLPASARRPCRLLKPLSELKSRGGHDGAEPSLVLFGELFVPVGC